MSRMRSTPHLGPTLWNIYYDGVLKIRMPIGVTLVGFADDLAVVVTARTKEDLQSKTNAALLKVGEWMTKNGLDVAPEKTEAVLLIGKRRLTDVQFTMQDKVICPKDETKYLGVQFGRSRTGKEHVMAVTKKAGQTVKALGCLMPNVGGPKASKRKVMGAVVNSILLYAAPVWERALRLEKYRMCIGRVQRNMMLRICSAYRTVSTEALLVVAGVPPIDLLIEERGELYRNRERTKSQARELTIEKWQSRWNGGNKGAWTRLLIPDIKAWVQRRWGETNYHLTQALTGHGCFGTYLDGIGKAVDDRCWFCGESDTPEHTIFECEKWATQRATMHAALERELTVHNMISTMMESRENWTAVSNAIVNILKEKERVGRARQNPNS